MAATVVDGAELASGRLIVLQELAGGGIKRLSQHLGLHITEGFADVLQGRSQCEELT